MTWAHPEFRVSAFTVGGNAFGVVAPSIQRRNERGRARVPRRARTATRCRSARWCSPPGSGGVFPKGIPVGTVIGTVREEAGWERVYRLRPAANPGSAAHVLVLVGSRSGDLAPAFPSDSQLEAMRLDSIARVRRADSLAQAADGGQGRSARFAGPQSAPILRRRAPPVPGGHRPAGATRRSPRGTQPDELPPRHPAPAGCWCCCCCWCFTSMCGPGSGMRGSAPISC